MSMSVGGGESGLQGDINVTPMVDVMLVLLIIFMVVTPMLLQGFTATLPQGENLLERPADEARVTLGIDVAGQWYLNRERVNRADVSALLAAEFAAQPDDKVLFLKAHHDLPYEQIAVAMQVGRDAGARVLAAVSDPTPGSVQRREGER
ncbi:MAG: protein TolR [Gemmatimonadetes bacterium]|nr:protein TolR [Gemmatimonadota bacterium]